MALVRRCLRCRALIAYGSYCAVCGGLGGRKPHGPRPASPGRRAGRWLQARRAELYLAQGGCCAWCAGWHPLTDLQLHHLDHDHRNDTPANHVLLCRSCHARAGQRKTPA